MDPNWFYNIYYQLFIILFSLWLCVAKPNNSSSSNIVVAKAGVGQCFVGPSGVRALPLAAGTNEGGH